MLRAVSRRHTTTVTPRIRGSLLVCCACGCRVGGAVEQCRASVRDNDSVPETGNGDSGTGTRACLMP